MPGIAAVVGALLISIPFDASLQDPSAETRDKLLEQARKSLVRVELFLKAVPDEETPAGLGETTSSQALDQQQRQVIRFRKPIQLMGVVISPREVFVPDTGINPHRIDRWEVVDSAGTRTHARFTALLREAPTVVLAPVDPGVAWKPAEFIKAELKATDSIALVQPDWAPFDLRWLLKVGNVAPTNRWDADSGPSAEPFWVVGSLATGSVATDPTTVGESPAAAVTLIFDRAGQMLGVGLSDRVFANRTLPPWRGVDLANAARTSVEELEELQKRLISKVSPSLYPVKVEFRRPKGGFQALPESELLAWAVGPRLLIAPGEIYRQVAARIARITVQLRGMEVEAEFVGQARDLSLVLLKLPEDVPPVPSYGDLTNKATLQLVRPNISLTIARKYGVNDLRPQYTRSLGLEYGYKNRVSPRFTPAPYIGSLVFDLDGAVLGLFTRARRPIEELEVIQSIARQGTASNISSVEFYDLDQLAEIAKDPSNAIDRRVVRRDEKDQDRRAWLGVECSAISKDLAESLGCRKEAKDGAIGMMVNQIYPDSPAERIGLQMGDVLLSLELPERDQPVLLAMPRGRGQGETGGDGQGASRAPWPSQNNFLNGVLTLIGEQTQLELSYWRDGKMHKANFDIELAPPDQDTAAQFKDEQVGITVKEITYEVRAALRLKPEDAGVVVSKVESGTPAGRARINPNEIIQAVDGERIDSPAKFEAIVQRAQEQKKDQLRLTVVDRGRSRFADLKFTQ
jgi:hypothetical protein